MAAYTEVMTILDVNVPRHRLPASISSVRRILSMAGCGLPAAALGDPAVAACARAHGIAVTACGDEDLDLVLAAGVRPVHVVLRCNPVSDTIRRAATLGVVRFVVSTDRHVEVLCCSPQPTKHIYLENRASAALCADRLDVVGIHCDVDDPAGAAEWGAAAERLLSRMAQLRSRGSKPARISLAGGAAASWLSGHTARLRAIASAVDDALDEGCARWRLPRPAVVLAPLTP